MAPAMEMSRKSVNQYTEKMRERYSRMTGKRARSALLDEFTTVTNFERKYAIKVLGKKRRKGSAASPSGRKPSYSSAARRALKTLWLAMDQPCGKRMKDMLPIWIVHRKKLKETTRTELLSMSASTIDRILKSHKIIGSRRVRPPRGDSAIKAAVEIRAESWDVKEPGWTEIDTVAHCGGDMSGSFAWTLTSVDINSGWTEVRIIWNCGQHTTLQGLKDITAAQPFALLGIDSDNGGEFLNYHLHSWCLQKEIKQTRSRPYRKNDQAYVEQKNYTHVRQLLGYDRISHQETLEGLNETLRLWSLWKNLYNVTMEQTSKRREGSRQIRTHAKTSRTPAQRLLDCPDLDEKHRAWIEDQLKKHDPFVMKRQIETGLAAFWKQHEDLEEKVRQEKAWEEEALASEGSSPLRSDKPSLAKKSTPNQAATVSP